MHVPNMLLQKPPGYVLASILCSFDGLLFGIDTGTIGPVTATNDFAKSVGEPSPTVHGLIVSSVPIPAAISSPLAAYFLFGACALLTAAVCFLFVPETRGLDLGEIERALVR